MCALKQAIGARLHAVRQCKRLRLEKLSKLTGSNAATIDEIELGKGQMEWLIICQLADALDVPVANIFDRKPLKP